MKKKPSGTPEKIRRSPSGASPQEKTPFPVVGIGASAGGLEAIETFLRNVQAESTMAFVIVQHLDPVHKGFMVELLQRVTPMPVQQVTGRTPIKPGQVYVIPPNRDMSMQNGTLHLIDPVEPHGLRHPIDFFFRSMAEDRKQYSIGVILSGMGSDGTLGLGAVKENGGGCFVQEPASAKFEGMPRSAIEAGLADVMAPPDELPAKITTYLNHQFQYSENEKPLRQEAHSNLEKVLAILRAHTRQDFSLYKKSTIYRRIERRMGIHQIDTIAAYVRFLHENPQETDLLFKELLIGVTSFFRDPDAWDELRTNAIPALVATRPSGGTIRAWVAGCSTGEEAYSLAIVFREALEALNPQGTWKLQIFATDLDKDAIDKARAGNFPSNIAADVSAERLRRFFVPLENGWQISNEIRELVVFAIQNVIMDPPFTRIDILVCRNLMIYWEQELQKKLLPLFHYSLNPGGILFLGSAETIGTHSSLFEPVCGKIRIFRKIDSLARYEQLDFPASFVRADLRHQDMGSAQGRAPVPELNLKSLTDQLLLQHYTPSAVLTNVKGDIIYISGRTGKYLEPAAGKANWNVFVMAREGLAFDLEQMYRTCLGNHEPVTKKGVTFSVDGKPLTVNLTVRKLDEPESMKNLVLVVFSKVDSLESGSSETRIPDGDAGLLQIRGLEADLRHARDEVLTVREEMQSSQEELKSANEELQSANEELQSTNEELTTSKEEMQSLNEELQTVNNELQSKVTELSQASNDMKNLLNSTDIATLFLDESLNIRRFTTRTATIIKLIASDIGRPVTDIVTELDYPTLADDALEVLRTLIFIENQVPASDGRWFNVRIMPYRTLENRIDGLVITFSDISVAKLLEARLTEDDRRFTAAIESIGGIVATLDKDLRYTWFCDPHHELIPASAKGRRDDELAAGPCSDELMGLKRSVLETGKEMQKELEIRLSDGKMRTFLVKATPLTGISGEKSGVLIIAVPKRS
jgi:two-component system, chemotaxis family, CheB/CheR fusion protein